MEMGRALGEKLSPGDVVFLIGDLGAGKTAFARGVARGLKIEGPVPSPTFTLMHAYLGRLPLHHFDLYRLSGSDELEAAGLLEYIGGDAVALIEWPEACRDALPARHLEVKIDYGAGDGERVLTMTPRGGFPQGGTA